MAILRKYQESPELCECCVVYLISEGCDEICFEECKCFKCLQESKPKGSCGEKGNCSEIFKK
jgi:hypothetical protein